MRIKAPATLEGIRKEYTTNQISMEEAIDKCLSALSVPKHDGISKPFLTVLEFLRKPGVSARDVVQQVSAAESQINIGREIKI